MATHPQPLSDHTSRKARMVDLIERLAPAEGYTQSLLDGVTLMRSNHSLARTPA